MEEQWKYWISPKALSVMANESWAKYPKETGGILIGQLQGFTIYIEAAVGPGPKAIHKSNSFTRDGDYSQRQLDEFTAETAGQWDYIGEWHSHPRKMGLSSKDIDSLRKIQTDPLYDIHHPVLGLLIFEQGKWVYEFYMAYPIKKLLKS